MRTNTFLRPTSFTQKLLLVVALSGAMSFALVSASLGDAAAQDDKELMELRSKFQRALELKQGKNWAGALKLFREVGSVKMTPQVRYHIASCEEKLGKLVIALGGYELALAQAEGMHPSFVAEVQASVDDLKARIPKLIIERGEGAEAAVVELDGVQLGASSIGVETPIDPGPHTVIAKAPGFEPYRETVTVAEGSVEVLQITLTPLAADDTPPDPVSDPGEEKSKGFGVLPFVVGGAGLAVAATGGVFLGLSQGKASKVKEICGGTDCSTIGGSELSDALAYDKSARTFETVGWIGVGVGVAAVGTSVLLYVIDPGRQKDSESQAGVWLSPAAPSSDAGFSVVGRF